MLVVVNRQDKFTLKFHQLDRLADKLTLWQQTITLNKRANLLTARHCGRANNSSSNGLSPSISLAIALRFATSRASPRARACNDKLRRKDSKSPVKDFTTRCLGFSTVVPFDER